MVCMTNHSRRPDDADGLILTRRGEARRGLPGSAYSLKHPQTGLNPRRTHKIIIPWASSSLHLQILSTLDWCPLPDNLYSSSRDIHQRQVISLVLRYRDNRKPTENGQLAKFDRYLTFLQSMEQKKWNYSNTNMDMSLTNVLEKVFRFLIDYKSICSIYDWIKFDPISAVYSGEN